ncbi:hypothetical protein C3L33_04416, partial [Rhododendron williamsianum]
MSSDERMEECLGWAARDASGFLSPYKFSRRVVGSDDVSVKITHCGVCYADVAWTRDKLGGFGGSKYPLVPGHEIVGIVKEVGSNAQGFKVGDHVGVGTLVNSCRDCEYCSRIPDVYPLPLAAPLLCAGITVYSPMMRHKMNEPGKSLGVIGLGGLGHLAVKFGKAFGLSVTVFSTSLSKKDEALNKLGADGFVISSDEEQMKAMAKSLDFIIDTASGDHPFDPYMSLLKTGGTLVLVGVPTQVKLSPISLISGNFVAFLICIDKIGLHWELQTLWFFSGRYEIHFRECNGGIKERQEMVDFCAAHSIYPDVEIIPIQYINEALERLIKGDVKYRFVIDIENSLK